MHGPRVPSEGHGLATMAAPMPTAGTCRARLCLAVRPWAARRVGATAGTMTWGVTGPELGPGGQEGPSAYLSRHRTPGVGLPGMPGASCRRGCARGPSRPQCLHLLSGDASRGHQLGVAVGIDATMVARPCPSQMMSILCITPTQRTSPRLGDVRKGDSSSSSRHRFGLFGILRSSRPATPASRSLP